MTQQVPSQDLVHQKLQSQKKQQYNNQLKVSMTLLATSSTANKMMALQEITTCQQEDDQTVSEFIYRDHGEKEAQTQPTVRRETLHIRVWNKV